MSYDSELDAKNWKAEKESMKRAIAVKDELIEHQIKQIQKWQNKAGLLARELQELKDKT